jgi:hypothetical protein
MRIAKPMLLVSTPVGVGWGLVEAARFHAWLAALMALLISVVGAFLWMTVSRIRRERGGADANSFGASAAPPAAPPAHRS